MHYWHPKGVGQWAMAPLNTPLHLLRISTSFTGKAKKGAFLWQITSCSLIDLLIIAVRIFQRFSDRSFVRAFKPILIFKLDWTVKCNLQNTKRPQ